MSKKTRGAIKNYQLFFFFFLLTGYQTFSKTGAQQLATADSLYTNQKYTESFEIYEYLYTEQGISSPATLLKMAYIKEGLGDYSNALFYLSAYFQQTLDKKALDKIDELVEANELTGYENRNNAYVQGVAFNYSKYILGALLVLLCVGLIIAVRQVIEGKSPVFLAIMLFLLIPMVVALNYDFIGSSAIVVEDTTYLMDGPSGSANVMETLSKGHKLSIKDSDGIWSKVRWEESDYYVRNSKLKEII